MNDATDKQATELRETMQRLAKRVRALTVTVVLMVLAVFVLAATIYGYLVEYHSFEPLLYGSVSVGCAILGFAFGWFAGRKA